MSTYPKSILALVFFTAAVLCTACSNKNDNNGGTSPTRTQIAAPVGGSPTPSPKRAVSNGAGAQVLSVSVAPAKPTAKDTLVASAQVSAGALPEYQWYLNGDKIPGQTGTQLQPGAFKKGDTVEFEVIASGPDGKSAPQTARVKIENQFPQISSSPSGSPNGYQVVATDGDGDKVTFKLENAPPNMTISTSGLISWPPPYEPGKKYEVRIIAADSEGAQAIQVVPITVPGGA